MILVFDNFPCHNGNMETFDDVLEAVGPRLRTLRVERGTTLAQLSESTGISVSTLSRLESGQRRPTLELLLPLARAHQVQLDELVDAPATGDPRIYAKPIQRHGTVHIPLTRRPGGLQAFKQILPEGYPGTDMQQKTHEGYDWIYVLSGQLRLRLGDNDFMLKEGEVAEFDTRVPHWFGNPGPGPTEALCLYGTQGERMHVRARTK
jgi:transcriptional regulator with XRE-family HTH domain